jgi:hypothetical protein
MCRLQPTGPHSLVVEQDVTAENCNQNIETRRHSSRSSVGLPPALYSGVKKNSSISTLVSHSTCDMLRSGCQILHSWKHSCWRSQELLSGFVCYWEHDTCYRIVPKGRTVQTILLNYTDFCSWHAKIRQKVRPITRRRRIPYDDDGRQQRYIYICTFHAKLCFIDDTIPGLNRFRLRRCGSFLLSPHHHYIPCSMLWTREQSQSHCGKTALLCCCGLFVV